MSKTKPKPTLSARQRYAVLDARAKERGGYHKSDAGDRHARRMRFAARLQAEREAGGEISPNGHHKRDVRGSAMPAGEYGRRVRKSK